MEPTKPNGNGIDEASNEPLIVDFATMQNGYDSKRRSFPLSPSTSTAHTERPKSWLPEVDTAAPAPQIDLTRRDIHVPSRTSSNTPHANKKRMSLQRQLSAEATSSNMTAPIEYQQQARSVSRTSSTPPRNSHSTRAPSTGPTTMRSSADSVVSFESQASSFATQALAPLQENVLMDDDRLSPLLEDDPKSFDLVCAPMKGEQFSLEARAEQLLSVQHLKAIFADTASLLRFTSFLSVARPASLPILVYYLDALKALRAISYANAVAEALGPIDGLDFTETPARPTLNAVLDEKANRAFDVMVQNDLPAFITHVFARIASVSIAKRVTGNMPPILREASEGLAEVFCLTDPSRLDNPIIFASEEFHRTTQYGVGYAIGRNCRFLQGPKTSRCSVARFGKAAVEGKDHSEVLLNYRRDGSPFMNLLMTAPLFDSRGTLRYFIGAQIDVSGLAKDATDLEAFRRMLDQQDGHEERPQAKGEFQELSEMFTHTELDTVRRFGGNMHKETIEDQDSANMNHRPRLLIQDRSTFDVDRAEKPQPAPDGRLTGPYKNYLIVRPAPSLRILFTSPSLRVPGILQSRFLGRIGGSSRVRESLRDALSDGSRGVTAKIRWLSHDVSNLESSYEEGRPRWIHCTPLLGPSGAVGVWMVVIVDEEQSQPSRRFRQAPPVSNDIRGKEFEDQMDPWSPRSSSLAYANAHGGARHAALDTLRPPQSPCKSNSPMMHEQRALRSTASSIRDYASGYQGSTDSFAI
ncbi:hypothetical protein EJ02DRAFT_348222 [Clathrospora elynae]|uniref:PAC domain-containing protein n=1 Tax=Clathrospora elynae TaxID=706981 RepID=A0A6A5SNI4_9PLEO|nr:hypothetical protein EJ02DRAFT_348222 [Clathrospora elynae]